MPVVLQVGFKEVGFLQDRFEVREALEAILAVIATHATVTDASEGKVGIGVLHHRIIDGATALAA